jgi:hypothetical protein
MKETFTTEQLLDKLESIDIGDNIYNEIKRFIESI